MKMYHRLSLKNTIFILAKVHSNDFFSPQEMSRTKIELDDLRQRLNKAERELINSKEECIHMTANMQALEREVLLPNLSISFFIK